VRSHLKRLPPNCRKHRGKYGKNKEPRQENPPGKEDYSLGEREAIAKDRGEKVISTKKGTPPFTGGESRKSDERRRRKEKRETTFLFPPTRKGPLPLPAHTSYPTSRKNRGGRAAKKKLKKEKIRPGLRIAPRREEMNSRWMARPRRERKRVRGSLQTSRNSLLPLSEKESQQTQAR